MVCVLDEIPEPGSQLHLYIEWTGQPKPKHVREYRQWMLGTLQTLCYRWNAKILYALESSPQTTELWEFEPGKPPKLEKTLPVGLP
jgi:hypothetical protein